MVSSMLQTCTNLIKKPETLSSLRVQELVPNQGLRIFVHKQEFIRWHLNISFHSIIFIKNPKGFYQFAVENLYHPEALPNKGHEVLTQWENEGKVSSIITQNIDGLHQKAGSKQVIEFHGTMKTASCQNCQHVYSTEEMINRRNSMDDFYICNHCRTLTEKERYIKPDVVLFGDSGKWFSIDGFNEIINIINQADCLLVLGTSLKVTPFSTFPQYRRQGTPLIIINKGDSPYDRVKDSYVIHNSIGETLTKINNSLNPPIY